MATTSQNQVLASLKSCLTSGAYSDLAITCGNDTYKVHKVIVCPRANFFTRAVEFGGQEAQSGIVNLPEDEPEIVNLLVQYLYEGEYEPVLPPAAAPSTTVAVFTPIKRGKLSSKKSEYNYTFPHTCQYRGDDCDSSLLCPHHRCGNDCRYTCIEFACAICFMPALIGPSSKLLVHTKMYQVADKYEVVGLKELAREKFSRSCKLFWSTPDFHVAADHAFISTPEDDNGLRDLVIWTIAKHMELAQVPEIRALMIQHNSLALGILDAKSEELGWIAKT